MAFMVKVPFFYGKHTCHDSGFVSITLSIYESALVKYRAGPCALAAYIPAHGHRDRLDYDHHDLGQPGADGRVLKRDYRHPGSGGAAPASRTCNRI
ncbi:hypothetical protein AAG593_01505 [Citromicrobium bathyomarinum]|uniref:hypothetical protein n=1 Tax=Alteriqipengyuania lutimaris TaxID=1538146 RepID=UPI001CFE289A|nr:hypothetical protein [Alteriqipengyuania lutimaris]